MVELRKILLVGLGNFTHPQTRHSIGMLLLDYIASQLNLTWNKNKNWPAEVASSVIYVDPPPIIKSPKVKHEKTRVIKDNNKINKDIIIENSKEKENKEDRTNEMMTMKNDNKQNLPPPPSKKILKPKPEPIPLQITLMKPLLLMNISGKSVSKAVKELGLSNSDIIVIHDDLQREPGKISLKSGGSANGHNGVKSIIDLLNTKSFRRLRVGVGRPPGAIDDRSTEIISKWVLARISKNELELYNNEIFPNSTKQKNFNMNLQKIDEDRRKEWKIVYENSMHPVNVFSKHLEDELKNELIDRIDRICPVFKYLIDFEWEVKKSGRNARVNRHDDKHKVKEQAKRYKKYATERFGIEVKVIGATYTNEDYRIYFLDNDDKKIAELVANGKKDSIF
ncbi:9013_t:CDS:2 [Diversispora eburnea]|uniref:peptidyl-tRNA hydrolase n=1 Tax=Diversispora eburnea TaxID=1213867 RepID=A0A9N8V4V3_9GLOM|nr:9013_t:CDS:2 [Diversispora eburnea]